MAARQYAPAEEERTTQYGIVYPDGTVLWDADKRGVLAFEPADLATNRDTYDRWQKGLRRMAQQAGISPGQFVSDNKLVMREIVLTRDATVEAPAPPANAPQT